jgi:hypothetical protein
MLEWFAGCPALYQIAERSEFAIAKRAIKLEIQIHAALSEDVCQQVFDVQARAFDAVLPKVIGSRLDDFEHGFHFGARAFTRTDARGQ